MPDLKWRMITRGIPISRNPPMLPIEMKMGVDVKSGLINPLFD